MTTQLINFSQPQQLSLNLLVKNKNIFLKSFWIVAAIVFGIIVTANAEPLSILAALIIAIASLYPSYLWCCDRAKGLPLFPLLALNFLFTHSFPLVFNNINVQPYSALEHFISSLTVASFLTIATITWLLYVQKVSLKPIVSKELDQNQVFPFFITALILKIIYQIGFSSGYLWLIFPNSFMSFLRALTGSTSYLAIITLSYLLGQKLLKKNQTFFFISITIILLFVSGVGLYLNEIGTYLLLGIIGWMLGSKKIPWTLLIVSFLILAFLNFGKASTRAYYWEFRNSPVQPSEYVQVYQKWINNSFKQITGNQNNINTTKKGSIVDRASIIQMLLKVQKETGIEKPYLLGKTYAIIPQLLVPRLLNSNKVRGGEANHILSVYYGLQNYRATIQTSIGWGLLQEAYANFGWLGCWGLGIFLGSLYGWITRWSMNVSILSFRFLVALIFMMLALRAEITMGIFVSVIFQSLIILWAIRIFFMKTKMQVSN